MATEAALAIARTKVPKYSLREFAFPQRRYRLYYLNGHNLCSIQVATKLCRLDFRFVLGVNMTRHFDLSFDKLKLDSLAPLPVQLPRYVRVVCLIVSFLPYLTLSLLCLCNCPGYGQSLRLSFVVICSFCRGDLLLTTRVEW